MNYYEETDRERAFLMHGLRDTEGGDASDFAQMCIQGCVNQAMSDRRGRDEMLLNIIGHLSRRLAMHESVEHKAMLLKPPAPIMVSYNDLSDDMKAKCDAARVAKPPEKPRNEE